MAVLVLLVPVLALCGGGVAGAGEPPLADAGLDQRVELNATVLLDAAGSRDPDGSIQSYRWSVRTPDGRTITPATSDAPRTTLVVRQPGRYEVTVTVTDDDGQSATDTLYVDVAERSVDSDPPASSAPASDTTPGLPASTAPASDGVTDPAVPDSPTTAEASTDTTARDGCPTGTTLGTSAECLGVGDTPATVEIQGEKYVRQGSVHTYTATVSDRPSGNERLTWAGGLGTGNTLTRAFTEPPGSTVTISATVEDGEGHVTTDSIVVRVVTDNAPPEVRIEGPIAACVGEPVELEGYAVASEDHDRIVDATWHSDPTFVPQHPGQYQVGFSAMDRQSQTARTTHTVTVREEAVCEPSRRQESGGATGIDKLVIKAMDDNWVEGSEVSSMMRARGKVPKSGPEEKIADIGAAAGKFGEAAGEFATGNEETTTFVMSATEARRLSEDIRTTRPDSTVAGADGPRINEHERLKNARVVDEVETVRGDVLVVVRIGKDNEANPDVYDGDAGSKSKENDESLTDTQPESSLASAEEQKQRLESNPLKAARNVGNAVADTVKKVPVSVSPTAGSDRGASPGETSSPIASVRSESAKSNNREQRLRDRMPAGVPGTDSDSKKPDAGGNGPLSGQVDTASPVSDGVNDASVSLALQMPTRMKGSTGGGAGR